MPHSILAPSSAKRWTRCTASVPYCQANAHRIPKDRGSVYAAEGTQAHEYGEMILKGTMKRAKLPAEFAPVMAYVDACETLLKQNRGDVYVEAKVPLFYLKEQTGTVDFALVGDNGIFIRDLKYGAGMPVDAVENEQLAVYAQSLVEMAKLEPMYDIYDDLPVQIGIVQPRYAGGEIEKIWDTNVKELREFCNPIGEAAKHVLAGVQSPEYANKFLRFDPSPENCHWCPAKKFCHARASTAIEPLSVEIDVLAAFDDISEAVVLPQVPTLTDRQIVAIYRQGPNIKSLLAAVEEYLEEQAMSGKPVEGTKLVEGRQGNRAWTNEEDALVELTKLLNADELVTKKIKSPTAILKLLKDKTQIAEVETLISRSPGAPTLALESDKRLAIQSVVEMFSTLEDE